MKRFIRYLYEYEQGRRSRNVGFVKVEQSDGESIIHIHGKGLYLTGMENLKLSLLCPEAGGMSAIGQGEIAYMGSSINYRLRYTNEDTGVPENYENIAGMLLESRTGRKFVAMWDDKPVNVEKIRPWREPVMRKEREEVREPVAREECEEMREPVAREERGEMREPVAREECEEVREPATREECEEVREPATREEMYGSARAEEPGQPEPCERQDVEEETEEPVCPWKVTKIQRREISMLPRCEWRLANNNFLLHGYYNYRHLVLLDDGKILKLGVPGIYHEKEARAARSLGFPEFISADRTHLVLTDEEKNDDERFGYWCRQVRR